MTRAISPPEATWATGCMGVLVFALNKNATRSCPSAPSSLFSIDMVKRTLGMPNAISLSGISFSMAFAALARVDVSWSARSPHSLDNFCSFSSSSAISSSLLSMRLSFASMSVCNESNSSIVVTLCFCSREYILSSVELTCSRRCGSNSMLAALVLTSCKMSFNSM